MLQTLREHSGSWFVKVLFGVLVASFALWGVGDIFRNYTSMRPVATIGGKSITQEEFLSAYHKAVNNIQHIAKGRVTSDDIKNMGVSTKVLDNLIDQAALTQHIHDLGIVVSDVTVRDQIQSLPALTDKGGTFDREKFAAMLSNAGLTESGFVREVRSSIERHELINSLGSGLHFPKDYLETLYRGLEEKKIFMVAQIPLTHITVSAQPTQADLEELYKQNQDTFTLPEYRELAILYMDPAVIRNKIQISDEQLADEYNNRKIDFLMPEKRDAQQIIFTNAGVAARASEEIKKGKTAQVIATQLGGNFVDLPQISRDKLTQEQANVVFALNVGDVSAPVESALGWSVFCVTKIQPESQKSLEEVRSKLAEEMKSQQANDQLADMRNKIEDALAGGASIQEVAQEHSFSSQLIPAMDQNGKDINGKEVLEGDYKKLVIEHAMNLAEGADSPIVDLANGKSFVVRLMKVTAPAVPPLAEIRNKVVSAWIESKQQQAAAELAQEIVKQVKSSNDLVTLAKQKGLTTKVLPPLSRSDMENKIKEAREANMKVVRQGFTLKNNQAAIAPTGQGFEVIMVQKTVPFDLAKEKEKFEKFTQSLSAMAGRDFEQLYVKHLRVVGQVSINDKVMDSMVNRQG